MANPVFSGGNIAGDVLPDVTGRKMGSLTQLWNFFAQKLNYAGATSGQTIVQASAVASGTLTLPASTGTLAIVNGVTDGSSAAAGIIGQFLQTKQTSTQSLSSTTALNLASVSLTAGDWDVSGNALFTGTSTTGTNQLIAISTSNSSVAPQDGSYENETLAAFTSVALAGFVLTTPVFRVSLTSTTSYFLIVQANFASGTVLAQGSIRARRVR